MTKKEFINEGGIQGAGTGHVDTQSKDWQDFLEIIKQHSLSRPKAEHIATRLEGIESRMEGFLAGEVFNDTEHVGTLIQQCVEALEIKNKDFAAYIGIKESNLSAMFNGRRKIRPEFALKLEQIFSIPSILWLNVQSKNELSALRNDRTANSPKLSVADLLAKAGQPQSHQTTPFLKNESLKKSHQKKNPKHPVGLLHRRLSQP